MRTLSVVAACLIMCMTCRGEGKENTIWPRSAGIDIGSTVHEGAVKLMISQQFYHHWSVDACHTVRLRMVRKRADHIEEEHYGTLGYAPVKADDSSYEMMTCDLTVSYWLNECFRGMFIQAGCRSGIEMRCEGIMGLGYSIKVWKGLRCSLTYDTSIGKERKSHLGLTISYVMK